MVSSQRFSPGSATPRWATQASPGRSNFAPKVAWTAAALGFRAPGSVGLMPHQMQIVGIATEIGPSGLPAFRLVVIEEPRQQGKSVSILSLMTARGLEKPGTMISYSAQTRLAGRRRFLDVWWPRISRSPGLRKVMDIRKGYGSEAFTFANGSMIMLASGTETSDHGDTLDLAVIDEAWAQRDDTIEQAVKPAMMTRDHAQLWVVSTAGNELSAYFKGKVEAGRAAAEAGMTDTAAYFGYSAPDDAEPGDPATWYGCMPALGITVREEVVAADFATMELAEFRRAYLCQWPEVAKPGWGVIAQDAWLSCQNPSLRPAS
jgi:phage terminase large subunit-like protein